jgi:hypothetical protein
MYLMANHFKSRNPLLAVWSPKGGSGTSVAAAVLAISLSEHGQTVLVDASGDQPAIFGMSRPSVGFAAWAAGGVDAAPAGLARLAVPVTQSLSMVALGESTEPAARVSVDQIRLAFPAQAVVVDLGCLLSKDDLMANIAGEAEHSLMVMRACYLAAQHALSGEVRRDGIVLIDEPGRVLRPKDLCAVLNSKIVATVDLDPALARLVDAGRMAKRLPRSVRPLQKLAEELLSSKAQGSKDRNVA